MVLFLVGTVRSRSLCANQLARYGLVPGGDLCAATRPTQRGQPGGPSLPAELTTGTAAIVIARGKSIPISARSVPTPVLKAYAEGVVMLRDLSSAIKNRPRRVTPSTLALSCAVVAESAGAADWRRPGRKVALAPRSAVRPLRRAASCRRCRKLVGIRRRRPAQNANGPRETAGLSLPGHIKGAPAPKQQECDTPPRDPFVVDMHSGVHHIFPGNWVLLLPEIVRSGGHGAGSPLSQPGLA